MSNIIPDIRTELFSQPIIELDHVPDNADKGYTYQRIIWFIPPVKGHFEVLVVPIRKGDQGRTLSEYRTASPEERRRLAKSEHKNVEVLSDTKAAQLLQAERVRRQRWADLSDHLFGIKDGDLSEIQAELKLSDEELRNLQGIAKTVTLLVGTVSNEDLKNAREAVANFKAKYTPDEIDDSRHLSKRVVELNDNVKKIMDGRKRLQEIQKKRPLLFQSPEDRARFHPIDNSPTKENFIAHTDTGSDETDVESSSAAAGRTRKGAAR